VTLVIWKKGYAAAYFERVDMKAGDVVMRFLLKRCLIAKVDLTQISSSIDPPELVAHSLLRNDSRYAALCAEE
jgi:hypothetical protein